MAQHKSRTLEQGLTSFTRDQWAEFMDILLDHQSLGVSHANPVVMILHRVLKTEDPYWVNDCFQYWNTFDEIPPTEIGFFCKHFDKGSDFWYDLYMVFEEDPENAVKWIFQLVSAFL